MKLTICYLPGDGIGPEVGAAALQILGKAAALHGLDLAIDEHAFGGAAIEAHGEPLPDSVRAAATAADAVLLGAVGGPRWDGLPGPQRPEAGLLGLRKAMGVWANIRVLKVHPRAAHLSPLKPERLEGVDIVFVRELTGGIYFGDKRRIEGPAGAIAEDVCRYSVGEIERIVRRGAEIARGRSGRLTSVDKANVLETSRLWRETAERVIAADYPDVTLDHVLVDAMAMHLVTQPARFDTVVTENMFGDILTDEASVLGGALGLMPSASLGNGRRGLFEPIHGSAPDIAGQGKANPIGMILSVAMMLRHSFAREDAAAAIEGAVERALAEGELTGDLGGRASTADIAQRVLDAL